MRSTRDVTDVERTPPIEPSRRLSVLKRPIEQAHLALGFRTFGRLDPDREALEVLNHVLGGGMSSRLLQTIREDRGLAYSVFSAHSEFCDAGALTIYAATTPGRGRRGARPRRRRARAACSPTASPSDELEVALGYLEGSLVLGLEDSGSRMARLGGSLTVRGYVRTIEEQLALYHAVTVEHVAKVAERVLSGAPSLAVVGPVSKRTLQSRVARSA